MPGIKHSMWVPSRHTQAVFRFIRYPSIAGGVTSLLLFIILVGSWWRLSTLHAVILNVVYKFSS